MSLMEQAVDVLRNALRSGMEAGAKTKAQSALNILTGTSEDLGEKRLLENIPVPVDWVAALIIAKSLKTPEGLKFISVLGTKWLDAQAEMVHALAQSGAGNIISAYANAHLIAQILEQNYMIRKGGAAGIMDGLNKLVATEELKTFLSASINVPGTLVFSGKGSTGRVLKGLIGGK